MTVYSQDEDVIADPCAGDIFINSLMARCTVHMTRLETDTPNGHRSPRKEGRSAQDVCEVFQLEGL